MSNTFTLPTLITSLCGQSNPIVQLINPYQDEKLYPDLMENKRSSNPKTVIQSVKNMKNPVSVTRIGKPL
jgi:hypothetical protein